MTAQSNDLNLVLNHIYNYVVEFYNNTNTRLLASNPVPYKLLNALYGKRIKRMTNDPLDVLLRSDSRFYVHLMPAGARYVIPRASLEAQIKDCLEFSPDKSEELIRSNVIKSIFSEL